MGVCGADPVGCSALRVSQPVEVASGIAALTARSLPSYNIAMIIKHISAKTSAKTRHYARVLLTYFIDPDPRKEVDPDGLELALTLDAYVKGEQKDVAAKAGAKRVLFTGAAIAGEEFDWLLASEEMEHRLAERSKHIKKPARHSVASFRADEMPTEDDCRQAVEMLTDELDCTDGVTLWAAHGDTDNVHIHVIHIPIDENGSALPFGPDGKYKEAMQRAIARIEHAQELTPEPGSRYQVVNGDVARRPELTNLPASSGGHGPPLNEETLRFERETGIMSFTRFCQERVAHRVENATTWDEVHRSCAPLGVGVRRSKSSKGTEGKGAGGVFYAADGNEVKLSSVGRTLSWTQLNKPERLGPYQPPSPELEMAAYVPVIIDARQALRQRDASRVKEEAKALLSARIAAIQAARRATEVALRAEWVRHRADAQALKLKAIRKCELMEALRRIHTRRILETDTQYLARVRALRGVRRGIDAVDDPNDLDMDALGQTDCLLVISWSPAAKADQTSFAFDGFTTRQVGETVQYWRTDDPQARQPAFVERGSFIWVNDRSDEVLAVALLLAKARHGDVAAYGDADFVRRCRDVGRRMDLDVTDGGRIVPKTLSKRPNTRQSARDRALDAEVASSLDRIPKPLAELEHDHSVAPSTPSPKTVPVPAVTKKERSVKPRRIRDVDMDR